MTDLAQPRRSEPLRAQRADSDTEPERIVFDAQEPATNGARAADTPAPPVVCPNCSEPTQLRAVQKLAEEFCLACDHPLFWIPAFTRTDDGDTNDDAGDASLRRRPGTAGRRRLVGRPCPECAEPNDVKSVYCLRCGSPMDPPPPPVVAEVVAPPAPVPEQPHRQVLPFWAVVMLAIIGLILLIAVVALIA